MSTDEPRPTTLCLDVGSTFTKAVLLGGEGDVLATSSAPTTVGTDVLEGCRAAREAIASSTSTGDVPPLTAEAARAGRVLVCSSAGGGLRLAVVGHERVVTAEAGHRVGLSAGARVEHVTAGPLDAQAVARLEEVAPDVVLLVGGTDGGNAEVLLHNARALASSALGCPVVVAGNVAAQEEVVTLLGAADVPHIVTDNVLPRIGQIAPGPARSAIREVFLTHVIGGKGLSQGPLFGQLVRAATPDAVLAGVEALAASTPQGGDVLLIDIGGATTDVYSVVEPEGEDAVTVDRRGHVSGLAKEVVAPIWHARTVEGDLGMRWNARHVIEAAVAEHLLPATALEAGDPLGDHAARVQASPGTLPTTDEEQAHDLEIARLAALVAARRHGRPHAAGADPRPLMNVTRLIGSGGVLRHGPAGVDTHVLGAVLADHGGGWRVPTDARAAVDRRYLLFAAGLLALAGRHDEAARVAAQVA